MNLPSSVATAIDPDFSPYDLNIVESMMWLIWADSDELSWDEIVVQFLFYVFIVVAPMWLFFQLLRAIYYGY